MKLRVLTLLAVLLITATPAFAKPTTKPANKVSANTAMARENAALKAQVLRLKTENEWLKKVKLAFEDYYDRTYATNTADDKTMEDFKDDVSVQEAPVAYANLQIAFLRSLISRLGIDQRSAERLADLDDVKPKSLGPKRQ